MCCYIDDRNLPEGCELQLVPVEEEERMVLPGSQSQYRLKPSEDYELVCSPVRVFCRIIFYLTVQCMGGFRRGWQGGRGPSFLGMSKKFFEGNHLSSGIV